jgi:hypothetical protein
MLTVKHTLVAGVTKVIVKQVNGVSKVSCACCGGCDPAAPWGPGYDGQPETIQVLDQTLTRVGNCQWVISQCYCSEGPEQWVPSIDCPDGCMVGDFWVNLNTSLNYLYFGAPSGPEDSGSIIFNTYERTGGDYPTPYGIWTATEEEDIPYTITISPP